MKRACSLSFLEEAHRLKGAPTNLTDTPWDAALGLCMHDFRGQLFPVRSLLPLYLGPEDKTQDNRSCCGAISVALPFDMYLTEPIKEESLVTKATSRSGHVGLVCMKLWV